MGLENVDWKTACKKIANLKFMKQEQLTKVYIAENTKIGL